MKADAQFVFDVLGREIQYVVPIFQRYYSWNRKHWNDLWDDIMLLYRDESTKKQHFIGALVCMAGKHTPTRVPDYILVDGQQRMVTLTILLSVIRDIAREKSITDLADEIEKKYLIDEHKKGLERYKVVSRSRDRESLLKLVDGHQITSNDSIRKAVSFYRSAIDKLLSGQSNANEVLEKLRVIVTRQLSVVVITLDSDENPYGIFETLNERGLPLRESDLIRNYVFMRLPIEKQDAFDEQLWTPFENLFRSGPGLSAVDLTDFYRDFSMLGGRYVPKAEIYQLFKEDSARKDTESLAAELRRFAGLYMEIHRPQTVQDETVSQCLLRLRKMDLGTSNPLVLKLLGENESGSLSRPEFLSCISALESFALRRSICGESTRGYNYLFPRIIRNLDFSRTLVSLVSQLSDYGWPDGLRFREALLEFKLYTKEKDKCRLILEDLEKHRGHKESPDLSALQIEHVMPQTLNDDWRADLGDDCDRVYEKWLHTLGNLTLTAYNPSLSNSRFNVKRELLAQSNLQLNHEIANCQVWNEHSIQARGEKLAREATSIWARSTV